MGSGGVVSGGEVGSGSDSVVSWGGTFGVYDNVHWLGPVHLGYDGRFAVQSSSNTNGSKPGNQIREGLGGMRLDVKFPGLNLRPYAQAEIGVASTNFGVNMTRTANFAYQVQGGVDIALARHIDFRAEYGAGEMDPFGSSETLQEFGAGLVVRFW